MEWKQKKEETLGLRTKAVDRARTPALLARQVSLALGQTEEARLYLSFTTGLQGWSVRASPGDRDCGSGTDRAGDSWAFFSAVKYNLLKSGYDHIHPELG